MSELAENLTGGSVGVAAITNAPGDEAHQVDPYVSAGGLLRQAREAAGLHIAALAVSLKVPVKKLEALEADRFDLLPDTVFIRALASSVCRTLKIDVAPVLERLPQTSGPKLTYQGAAINAPFRAPGDGPRPAAWAQLSRPAVLAGLALLLGALVLIFLPAVKPEVNEKKPELLSSGGNFEPPKSAGFLMPTNAVGGDATRANTADAANTPSATAAPGADFLATKPQAPAVAFDGLAVSPSAPGASAVQINAVATSATAAVNGLVVFTAKGSTWIEVIDSKGQVVLRRTLNSGETASASGALPLTAVVGRADATQVQVRGKAFDLSAFSKDNVARFEVR